MPPTSPTDGPDPEMLSRILAGECSESEAAIVRRALIARPDVARALERYLLRLDAGHERPPLPGIDESWSALAARMRAEPRVAQPPSPGTPARERHHFTLLTARPRRRWWRGTWPVVLAAASVAAFIALRGGRRSAGAPVAESRTWSTAVGQRADITLGDGTKIILAPGSRLRAAGDFGVERRDLWLDGEAFFQVVHDESHPFTVYAGSASAHDIGTAFAVRSYPTDSAVQIVVREGRVAMSGVGPLAAGDVGILAHDGRTRLRHGADVGALLGWLDGRLSYQDAPLARVVDDLRRWHGADIVIADSAMASLPFTGEIDGLAARPAVQLVAATLGLRVTREGERYTLAPDPRRAPRRATRTHRSAAPKEQPAT